MNAKARRQGRAQLSLRAAKPSFERRSHRGGRRGGEGDGAMLLGERDVPSPAMQVRE